MAIAPLQLLQASVDRAVDSALRALGSIRPEIQLANADALPAIAEDDISSEIIAHLCRHVAQALRGTEVALPSGQVATTPGLKAGLGIRR